MSTFPPLPTLTARGTDEPAILYGARALMFVLAEHCTAPLDDDALEAAEHAALVAVAAPEIATPALVNLNAARLLIAATLRGRQAERAAADLHAQLTATVAAARPAATPPRRNGPGPQRVASPRPRPNVPPSDGVAVPVPTLAARPF